MKEGQNLKFLKKKMRIVKYSDVRRPSENTGCYIRFIPVTNMRRCLKYRALELASRVVEVGKKRTQATPFLAYTLRGGDDTNDHVNARSRGKV